MCRDVHRELSQTTFSSLLYYRCWISHLFFKLLAVEDAAPPDKAGIINVDTEIQWQFPFNHALSIIMGRTAIPQSSVFHWHITSVSLSPSLQFPWWLVRPVCESCCYFPEEPYISPAVLHTYSMQWSGRERQRKVCWFTVAHWKKSNKAVTVMYVADMWLRAVASVAAHVTPLEGINWGLYSIWDVVLESSLFFSSPHQLR